jgi:hypothetical protein
MSQSFLVTATLLASGVLSFAGNAQSPSAETSVTINGKAIGIKYSAPSVRGRKIFGDGGQISKDPTWPVWRTGADDATALHTAGTLTIGSLTIPPGDYTVFTLVNVTPWQLIINKQTKQWGLTYNQAMDLGRVPMTVSKPSAPIEKFKITLSDAGNNRGKLQLEWENVIASVLFTVK